eukprot:GFUD01010017.1.p1 GENE.GFUD01010017.1~~GFUD01010017.1.p1  ORF type:complete len:208 (-),score=44.64 GFUD01010017.1:201-824(-)
MLSVKKVIVLISLLIQFVLSEGSDCGEGEVKDLDGSCVTKFVIPKRKAVCPKLTIDNGEIFLLGTGRMVQFYCDTGYVRVPDTEVAICQVQGHWSKLVPVCLKPGCQVPPAPSSGSVYLPPSYNSTLAVFLCSPGYTMSGPTTLACVDGQRWNGSTPQCNIMTAPQPQMNDQPVPVTGNHSVAGHTQNMASSVLLIVMTFLARNISW